MSQPVDSHKYVSMGSGAFSGIISLPQPEPTCSRAAVYVCGSTAQTLPSVFCPDPLDQNDTCAQLQVPYWPPDTVPLAPHSAPI